MTEHRYGRRALFDVFRRGTNAEGAPAARGTAAGGMPAARTSFSLDAFYTDRRERGEVTRETIPEVLLRDDLAAVATSRVGVDRPPPTHGIESPASDPPVNGKVRIRTYACLAWQRSFCTTCSERCPERAIVVELGRPRVEEDRCTGCGQCVRLCPAPVNGFDLVPTDASAHRSGEPLPLEPT